MQLTLEQGLDETRPFRGARSPRSPKSPRRLRHGSMNPGSTPWIVLLTSDQWIKRITMGFFIVWSLYLMTQMTSSLVTNSNTGTLRRFSTRPVAGAWPTQATESVPQPPVVDNNNNNNPTAQELQEYELRVEDLLSSNINNELQDTALVFPEASNLILIGDFGSGDQNQSQVANTLTKVINDMHPSPLFILSTGDQIYEHGYDVRKQGVADSMVHQVSEQSQSFNSPMESWLTVLVNNSIGNHDCEGSIDAMLSYAKRPDTLWYFPQRYYKVDHPVAPKTIVRLLVLDACDLVCGTEPRNKRCNGKMNTQTSVETRRLQYQWIEEQLAAPKPKGVDKMWKFVLSHWAIYSYAGNSNTEQLVQYLNPLLRKYHVHGYFSGHDHVLEHLQEYDRDWPLHYFVSGAGGYKTHTLQPNAREHADLVHVSLTNGFASVHITDEVYRVQFVDLYGQVLYTTEVHYAP